MNRAIEAKKRKSKMDCDLCNGSDLREVFTLRSERFSKFATKNEKEARRVCWGCAKRLFFQKRYNFGFYWRNLFLDGHVNYIQNRFKFNKLLETHA